MACRCGKTKQTAFSPNRARGLVGGSPQPNPAVNNQAALNFRAGITSGSAIPRGIASPTTSPVPKITSEQDRKRINKLREDAIRRARGR